MIIFNYETDFSLDNSDEIIDWLVRAVETENFNIDEISYIFCSDDYLLDINNKYLKHNTLTDIISFDETMGKMIAGDIFISIDRVRENADIYKVSFNNELHRVMIHGVLHFCGYKDKSKEEKGIMREKEDYYLSLRDFKCST